MVSSELIFKSRQCGCVSGCGFLGVSQGGVTGHVALHLVFNASLEVADEDLGLLVLILHELYGGAAKVFVQLDHDDGGSCALILGGVTACAAVINMNHKNQTKRSQLKVYSPLQPWILCRPAEVYITI